MASSSVPLDIDENEFRVKMAEFPCMFNMPCFDHPPRNRLKNRKDKLERELDQGLDNKEDERKAKNTLTWIYYQLGLFELAWDMNEFVLKDTGNNNIAALGNSVFIEWMRTGRVSEHFEILNKLREKLSYSEEELDAKAEQAYCLGKLGNIYNLMSAVKLYEEILALNEQDKWRYLLGLAYRRLAVMRGLEKYSGNKFSKERCHELAKSSFQKVARSTDKSLRALGLVNLAANYPETGSVTVAELENAVTIDPQNSEVYLAAGRPLIYIDAGQAVTWLEKAVELRPRRSACHHQLGKAYVSRIRGLGRGDSRPVRDVQEKAQRHLQQAYELSGKMNVSPLMDLARFHQSMSEREASTLLKSRFSSTDSLVSLIRAHRHLFYLVENERTYHHMLLSILASCDVMKKECMSEERHAVWAAMFESDQSLGDTQMKDSARQFCDILRKDKHNIRRCLKSISTFDSDGRIDNVKAIANEARDIQSSGQNAEALLFLELVSMRPNMDTKMLRDLHLQILETEAKECLVYSLGISSIFFRQSFDMSFSRRGELHRDEFEADADLSIKVDMVVLFNDSVANTTTLCADTAYGLEDAVSTLFGLKVAFNPIVDVPHGCSHGDAMADFVNKHQTDVIMIVFQGNGAETQYLLEKIRPFIGDRPDGNEGHRPPVVLVQCHEQRPLSLVYELERLPCLSLGQPEDSFPNLFCDKEVQEKADRCEHIKGLLYAYFQGNLDNAVKLFRHMTCHGETQAYLLIDPLLQTTD